MIPQEGVVSAKLPKAKVKIYTLGDVWVITLQISLLSTNPSDENLYGQV